MIIDASVAFKLVVDEPGSEAAIGWLAQGGLAAPSLVHAEVGNALWKRVLRNEIVADGEIGERLSDLRRYVRTVDEVPVMPRALDLAIGLRHAIYDCVYLALAEAEGDRLLTADAKFAAAVRGTPHEARVEVLAT